MPAYSTKDCDQLVELMQSQIIFPYVQEEAERDSLQSRLLEVPGRLLSINTLIQDTIYLKQSVRAFQNLLPKQFKGTINELQGPGIIIKASTMFNSFKRFHFALERERRWNWRTC